MSAAPEVSNVAMKKNLLRKHWKLLSLKLQENIQVVVDVDKRHQWMDYEEEGH